MFCQDFLDLGRCRANGCKYTSGRLTAQFSYLRNGQNVSSPLRGELLTEAMVFENGFLRVPYKNGLGIELNDETTKKHSINN